MSFSNCPKCGAAMPLTSRVCPMCGAAINPIGAPNSVVSGANSAANPAKTKKPMSKTSKIWLVIAIGFGTLVIIGSAMQSGKVTVNGISSDSPASNYVSGYSRNIMRMNGVDAYDSNGNPITLAQFAQDYLDSLNSKFVAQGQPKASAADVGVGLEPGNTLYRYLNEFFTDPDAAAVVGQMMIKDAG